MKIMRMSDKITEHILEILNQSSNDIAEIQRNELASLMGCVPSQINYVLSSRFTPEHGYIIESRRGGGGYIKITRVRLSRSSALMHIINSIGSVVDAMSARILLENCIESGILAENQANLINAAISSYALHCLPLEYKDAVRADILKQMLLTQI